MRITAFTQSCWTFHAELQTNTTSTSQCHICKRSLSGISENVFPLQLSISLHWQNKVSRLDRTQSSLLQIFNYFPCFYRASSYARTVLGIVILSVCLSFTRVLCDESKKHTADILIPHEKVITLVFWYRQRSVVDIPFSVKFTLKVTHIRPNINFVQKLNSLFLLLLFKNVWSDWC